MSVDICYCPFKQRSEMDIAYTVKDNCIHYVLTFSEKEYYAKKSTTPGDTCIICQLYVSWVKYVKSLKTEK